MKLLLILALSLPLSSTLSFARQGGSSTVGVIGPSGHVMNAFMADEEVQKEHRALQAHGYKATSNFPEVKLVNRFNCRTPEGPQYIGGRATFQICDSIFLAELSFKKEGSRKLRKIVRYATFTTEGTVISKEMPLPAEAKEE